MNYVNLIKKRGYITGFKNKDISDIESKFVNEIIRDAKDVLECDLDIYLLEDSKKVKESLNMEIIDAPAYIAFTTQDTKKGYENTGFIGEWIISRLLDNNIDATWLRVEGHDKEIYNNFDFDNEGYLITLLAIGHGEKVSNIAKIIKNKYKNSIQKLTNMGYSSSMDLNANSKMVYQLNIREFVFNNKYNKKIRIVDLENSGLMRVFQELHFAPTITFKQLWRVLIDEGKIFILVTQSDKIAKIEAGIMRFYLKESLRINGIESEWEDIAEVEDIEKYKYPEDVFVAGYFKY